MSKKIILIVIFSLISSSVYSVGVDASTQTKRVLSPEKSLEAGLRYLEKGERTLAIILMQDAAEEHHPKALYFSAVLLYNKGNCTRDELLLAFKYCNFAKKLGVKQATILFKDMEPALLMALLDKSQEPIKIDLAELLSSAQQGQDNEDDDEEDDESGAKKEEKKEPPMGMYT